MLAEIISIETPKKFVLNGFWFGPSKAKRAFIFVHGLGSIAFAHHDFLLPLVSKDTGVMFFNNRGHSSIVGILRKTNTKKGYKKTMAGMALEKFTDCVDDIEGAIRSAEKMGAKNIYLVGHSTGSQKVAYYLSKKSARKHVAGGILMAPISDYAGIKISVPFHVFKKALAAAEALMKKKKPNALLPQELWETPISAQRFISLYAGRGPEEIFPYWAKRNPAVLRRVKKPLFVILAEEDQHSDRKVEDLAKWFTKYLKDGDAISIIRRADHGFRKNEKIVMNEIKNWVS